MALSHETRPRQDKTIARITRTLDEIYDQFYQPETQLVCYHFPDFLNKTAIWSCSAWTDPAATAHSIFAAACAHAETYGDPQRFMLGVFRGDRREEALRTCSFIVVDLNRLKADHEYLRA